MSSKSPADAARAGIAGPMADACATSPTPPRMPARAAFTSAPMAAAAATAARLFDHVTLLRHTRRAERSAVFCVDSASSSRRRPGPIIRADHEKGSGRCLALRPRDATAAPGIMGPGLRRDDAGELLRALVRIVVGRHTPAPASHAATGCSTLSCASHDEIVPGIKPTRPYIMN